MDNTIMPPKKKPIKMADLAELAGVSKSTVSRALADNPLIPEATRERIKELAKKHNYRINKRARNFRTQETLTIAVLTPGNKEENWRLFDPFFLELLGSIRDTLNENGHELLLATTQDDVKSWILENVHQGSCDGVILTDQGSQRDDINELASSGVPMTVWGAHMPGQKFCSVGSDNELGGYLATQHLTGKGCKRIAFMGNPHQREVALRYKGYQKGLAEAGCEEDDDLLVNIPFFGPGAYEKIAAFLKSAPEIDGIFACSDVIAAGAVRALSEYGSRVPENVAIVGYDDIAMASYFTPPLTTIKQDCVRGGQELVDRLLSIIKGQKAESFILDTPLITRASSG